MASANTRVVRVLVDAPGMNVIVLWVASTETPMEVHGLICDALKGKDMLVGAYAPGQEIHPGEMLDFVLNPFKDRKPEGKNRTTRD